MRPRSLFHQRQQYVWTTVGWVRLWQLTLVAGFSTALALGQQGLGPFGGQTTPKPGWSFTGTSAFTSISSLRMPGSEAGSNAVLPTLQGPGAGLNQGGAQFLGTTGFFGVASGLSWLRDGERVSQALVYSGTYNGNLRYRELSFATHSFSYQLSRKLHPQWRGSFGIQSSLSNTQEYLFMPEVLSRIASSGMTFDQLSTGVLSGQFTNDQLASMLTGAPVVESPARSLLFGSRFFASAMQTGLTYSPTGRLAISIGGGLNRFQGLGGQAYDMSSGSGTAGGLTGSTPGAGPRGWLGQVTSGTAGVNVSYALSPRTSIGSAITTVRVLSGLNDSFSTSTVLYAARTLTPHWVVNGGAGVGFLTPMGSGAALITDPQFTFTGGMGYLLGDHSLMFNAGRSLVDQTGAGASNAWQGSFGWSWARPGGSWGLSASTGYQRLNGLKSIRMTGWHAGVSVHRRLSETTTLFVQYGSARNSGRLTDQSYDLLQDGVRIGVTYAGLPFSGR